MMGNFKPKLPLVAGRNRPETDAEDALLWYSRACTKGTGAERTTVRSVARLDDVKVTEKRFLADEAIQNIAAWHRRHPHDVGCLSMHHRRWKGKTVALLSVATGDVSRTTLAFSFVR